MRFSKVVLVTACAVASAATTLGAQQPAATVAKLAVGQWTGQVITPNGETSAVTYDVSSKNDTLAITINAAEHGSFAVDGIKLEADKLSFGFTPGPRVMCVLNKKDDGSYAGTCTDEGGGVAQLSMVPPKQPGS